MSSGMLEQSRLIARVPPGIGVPESTQSREAVLPDRHTQHLTPGAAHAEAEQQAILALPGPVASSRSAQVDVAAGFHRAGHPLRPEDRTGSNGGTSCPPTKRLVRTSGNDRVIYDIRWVVATEKTVGGTASLCQSRNVKRQDGV
jgi:hypothetical protein